MDVMKYFEENVAPHIEPDQHSHSMVCENELGDFIEAVIDAVETRKMPKVHKNSQITICSHISVFNL